MSHHSLLKRADMEQPVRRDNFEAEHMLFKSLPFVAERQNMG